MGNNYARINRELKEAYGNPSSCLNFLLPGQYSMEPQGGCRNRNFRNHAAGGVKSILKESFEIKIISGCLGNIQTSRIRHISAEELAIAA